jgi:hypothetical protein
VQSEAGITSLWKKIKTNYEAMQTAWPDMAAEIDAADIAARNRIAVPTGGKVVEGAGEAAPAEAEGWET